MPFIFAALTSSKHSVKQQNKDCQLKVIPNYRVGVHGESFESVFLKKRLAKRPERNKGPQKVL